MNHRTWSAACLMTLLLAGTAWSQTSSASLANLLGSSGTSTTGTTGTAATNWQQTVKQQLRGELAQVAVGVIHEFFQNLRTSVGLPAVATDPTTDLISILESAITDAVDTALTQ